MRIALAITNQAMPVTSVDQWLARLKRIVLNCQDCDLLMLPEYASMQCLDYAPPGLEESYEPAWMASEFLDKWSEMDDMAKDYLVSILPGTFADFHGAEVRNRAMFFFRRSAGMSHYQDKLHLTNEERDRMGWYLRPGSVVKVFPFKDFKTAITICHDVTSDSEFTCLKTMGVELVLIPSMVGMLGNIHIEDSYLFIREFARRRSEELGCYVAWVSAAGTQTFPSRQGKRAPQKNVGGAAIFKDGKTLAAIGPFEDLGGQYLILKTDIG